MERQTYHLSHQYPDSLPLTEGQERAQAWLINNALAYNLVALIEARTEHDALLAAQYKTRGQPVPRTVRIQAGNLLRETLPGDVLLASSAAWMVDTTGQLHSLAAYLTVRPPWKHLRQRPGQRATVDALAWSPTGSYLAAGDDQSTIQVVDVARHWHVHTYRIDALNQPRVRVEALAWSPDGALLAAGDGSTGIAIWQAERDLTEARASLTREETQPC